MLKLKPAVAQKLKRAGQAAGKVAQILLAAPVKLPGKVLQAARYLALAIGIMEAVQTEQEEERPDE